MYKMYKMFTNDTKLHNLITYNDLDNFKKIISSEQGYQFNCSYMSTPIMHAISINRIEFVKLLLEKDISLLHKKIKIQPMDILYTPIQWATFKHNTSISHLLNNYEVYRPNGPVHMILKSTVIDKHMLPSKIYESIIFKYML